MKAISGTWFEFSHHNKAEGKYWNDTCRNFTAEQWEKKIDEIASLGMKYIVFMNTSIVYDDYSESYFDSGIFPLADMQCKKPMEALFRSADRNNIRVFVSCGFYGNWKHPAKNMKSDEVREKAFKAMDSITEQYGHHKSFYGWYLPDETCVIGHFSGKFINYVNTYCQRIKEIMPQAKTMIAPYGTKIIKADRKYVRQLKKLNVDIIAYQDEVGVKKSRAENTEKYYRKLRLAHDKAEGPAIWADIEIFTFEGIVYNSALIPAPFKRIEKQIQSVSPYVDEILCYQYQGMANMPETDAFCGHPDSYNLYEKLKEHNKKHK